MLVAAVDVHDEDLVALHVVAGRLENELLAVGGEIGFRVLASEGELLDIAEMLFGLRGGRLGRRVLCRCSREQGRNAENGGREKRRGLSHGIYRASLAGEARGKLVTAKCAKKSRKGRKERTADVIKSGVGMCFPLFCRLRARDALATAGKMPALHSLVLTIEFGLWTQIAGLGCDIEEGR